MTTDEGDEVEFRSARREAGVTKVMTVRSVLQAAGLLGISLGAVLLFSARALIREEIGLHSLDQASHPHLRQQVTDHIAKDEAKQSQDRELLERVSRIEVRQIQMSDSVSRIDERLKGMDRFSGRTGR